MLALAKERDLTRSKWGEATQFNFKLVEEMEVPVEESFICITGLHLDYFFKNAEGDYYTFKLSSHDERRSMLQYLDNEEAWDPVCRYEDGIVWVSFIVE